jgi:hypothetical protein
MRRGHHTSRVLKAMSIGADEPAEAAEETSVAEPQ